MSGIRGEHVRVLNVDDETGHTGPRSAAGTGSVTEADGRSCRVADGAPLPRVANNGSAHGGRAHIGIARNGIARNGIAHSRIARGGVPHADVLDGTRHDTPGPEHRTARQEPRPDGLTSASAPAPTTRSGRGAANAGRPTEAGR
ncbi:hypothetical protein FHS35_003214 [Streptomyces umbrinus]|uniref:hypothetical protein n=1 Tax=Streptomyces TaxID=1883 RepID=UPI00167ED489|nr:hypothetical protein [Streptomyces umbrinus]MCR3726362.1 hypothetical protein [Streptomyces umbrinus]GHH32430.1 hypothetical protein GCM10018775_02010 [Streptomyces umbrinus]